MEGYKDRVWMGIEIVAIKTKQKLIKSFLVGNLMISNPLFDISFCKAMYTLATHVG